MRRSTLSDPRGRPEAGARIAAFTTAGACAILGAALAVAAVASLAPRAAGAVAPAVVPAPAAPPLEGVVFREGDSLAMRLAKVRTHLELAKAPARRIFIDKSERRMDLLAADEVIRRYVVNLGSDPVSDKVREGDGCTPEGDFFVCTRGPSKAFHRFLGLSYPNAEDAARGLAAGLIGKTAFGALTVAATRKKKPSWSTPLGGAIGIHGSGWRARVPGGYAIVDWTLGCIAVTDEEIQEIYEQFVTSLGVPVRIVP